MDYGSICSGVESASLAWKHLGWKATFFAEVEPFPAAVLMERFGATRPLHPLDPEDAADEKDRKQRLSWQKQIAELPEGGTIPNFGDFTLIKKEDINEKVDLIVGGTPCQDLSIAGKRLGFEGRRSVLALDFVRLCFELGVRWVVWENVPAALSSRNGEDFARFVSLLCGWEVPVPGKGWGKCGIVTNAPGYFGVSWRVLDAQYTRVEQFPRAVPQRRKRLFLVGYLGNWKYPCKVLFDGEMCGGHTPPSRTKGQRFASDTEGGIDTAKSIRMRGGRSGGDKGVLVGDNLSHTLATGNDQTIVALPKNRNSDNTTDKCSFNFEIYTDEKRELSPTIGALHGRDTLIYDSKTKWWDGTDTAGTLTTTSDRQLMPDKARLQCVVEGPECLDMRQIEVHDSGVAPTLIATDYKGGKAVCQEVCPVIDASYPEKMNNQDLKKLICYENHANDSRVTPVEVAPVITGRCGTGGNNLPLVQEDDDDTIGFIKNDAGGIQQGYWTGVFPTIRTEITPAIVQHECFNVSFCDANGVRKDRPNGGLYVTEAETSKTVTAGGTNAETVIVDAVALDGDKMKPGERAGGSGMGVSEEGVMYTQTAGDVHGVAYKECYPLDLRNATRDPEKRDSLNRQGVGVGEDGDPANTLTAAAVPGVGAQATVRRLLPIECERLMGFPDNHTRIPWKGKPEEECPDAPRYKACGNSMCVNCMMWLGERINAMENVIQSKSLT